MAVFNGTIFSSSLGMETGLGVIFPQSREGKTVVGKKKVLYLLHGYSDAYMAWLYKSNIERYAMEHDIVVIMPEVQHSFYIDMKYGMKYFTYVSEELPKICNQMFGISTKRQDTFVAGLSMGGYGAMKCALARPGQYAGVGAMSAAFDIQAVVNDNLAEGKLSQEFMAHFGGTKVPKSSDLYALAEKVAKLPAEKQPGLYIACGKQDFLIEQNRAFAAKAKELGFSCEYEEWDGVHSWEFWDVAIQKILNHFLGEPAQQ